jgi:hypothetical protein
VLQICSGYNCERSGLTGVVCPQGVRIAGARILTEGKNCFNESVVTKLWHFREIEAQKNYWGK